jgi:diguanylate cyclase (GGDEF)-like protein
VVIGSLNISRIGGQEAYFSETDFELIQLFAGQASIALRNAEAHHAVSLRAETDELTGLGNHGAFQRYLSGLLDGADPNSPEPRRIGLLMMDLDRFKDYNDRLGHPAGDALLRAIGGVIQDAARAGDRVFRYGGDEFVLVLADADAAEAAAVGDRIRRAVGRLTAREATPVTITVGAAVVPDDARDKNALISNADTALYHGKQFGENRVVRFADVPSEMRDLRATLEQLARATLMDPTERGSVEHLVEEAARLGAITTEREPSDSIRDTLLAIARSLESSDAPVRGHVDRVARLARGVAERLGCSAHETASIELAARLHGLEELGRTELVAVTSLRDVGEIVAAQRALSQGRSRRRTPDATSLASEIIVAANAFDELVGPRGSARARAIAVETLRDRLRGVRGEVLDALELEVGPGLRRVRTAPRRRQTDTEAVAGAA